MQYTKGAGKLGHAQGNDVLDPVSVTRSSTVAPPEPDDHWAGLAVDSWHALGDSAFGGLLKPSDERHPGLA